MPVLVKTPRVMLKLVTAMPCRLAMPLAQPGLAAFRSEYKRSRLLLVGSDGVALEEFLSKSIGVGESPLGHELVRSPGTSSNDL